MKMTKQKGRAGLSLFSLPKCYFNLVEILSCRYEDGDIPRGDSPGPGMTEESNEEAFERMMAMVEEDEEERSAAVQTQPTPPQPTTPSTPR